MTDLTHTRLAGSSPRLRQGLVARLTTLLALHRQRRDLLALDPRQLADLGLTPDEARAEALRPIWDVPQGWRN